MVDCLQELYIAGEYILGMFASKRDLSDRIKMIFMGEFKIFTANVDYSLELPYAEGGVRAGFPSPAQDFMNESIDLNRDLIHHSESTFYARAIGDSLKDADVREGDILVVDKSLEAQDGDMVICCVNDEFTLKFMERHEDYIVLCPANPAYQPIKVMPDEYFKVWGVVTYIIRKVSKRK